MRLLLAIDGSFGSISAARFVRRLAEQNPVEVQVLTVSYSPDVGGRAVSQPWYEEWNLHEQRRIEAFHAEIMTMLENSCSSITMTRGYGNVIHSILETAKGMDAELIVLGARGHSAIKRMLLGSVSDSVATQAQCSVVVVRSKDARAADSQSESEGAIKLLIGYDRSKSAAEAVTEMMEFNWTQDTIACVMSVAPLPFPFGHGDDFPADAGWESESVEQVRCDAERMASRVAGGIPLTSTQVIQSGHIGDAIVAEAEKEGSDIVVVGDSGHGLLEDLLMGSTTKFVLRHAPCTVWISRHHRKTASIDAVDSATKDSVGS